MLWLISVNQLDFHLAVDFFPVLIYKHRLPGPFIYPRDKRRLIPTILSQLMTQKRVFTGLHAQFLGDSQIDHICYLIKYDRFHFGDASAFF